MINRLRGAPPSWPDKAGSKAPRDAGVPFDSLVLKPPGGPSGSPGAADKPASPSNFPSWENAFEGCAAMMPAQERASVPELPAIDLSVPTHIEVCAPKAPLQNNDPCAPSDEFPLPPPTMVPDVGTPSSEVLVLWPQPMPLPGVEQVIPGDVRVAPPPTDGTQPIQVGARDQLIAERALQAEPLQPHAATDDMLHFEVRQGGTGRVTETVTVPWQLLAHMILSQQGQLVAPFSAARVPTLSDARPPAVPGMHQSSHGTMLVATGMRSTDQSSAVVPAPLSSLIRTPGSTDAAVAERPSPTMSAAAPWAIRLIRWASEHASETVVWLRDYTLDETAAAGLMKMLHAFGRAHGVHVTRLMFNGRELWRAPHSSV